MVFQWHRLTSRPAVCRQDRLKLIPTESRETHCTSPWPPARHTGSAALIQDTPIVAGTTEDTGERLRWCIPARFWSPCWPWWQNAGVRSGRELAARTARPAVTARRTACFSGWTARTWGSAPCRRTSAFSRPICKSSICTLREKRHMCAHRAPAPLCFFFFLDSLNCSTVTDNGVLLCADKSGELL